MAAASSTTAVRSRASSVCSWDKIGDSEADRETSPGQPPHVISLSYPQGSCISLEEPIQLHVGSYTELLPQMVGAAGAVFSVTPELPEGLELNDASGVVSGVPICTTTVQSYTITASNEGIEVLAQLVLAVAAGKIYTVVGSRNDGNTTPTLLPGLQQKLRSLYSLCAHRGKLYMGQDASIAEMDLQTGKVKLLLGTPGTRGTEGDGKQKEFAKVGLVIGMVVYQEELYFADYTHHRVRKFGLPGSKAPGLVRLVAGKGSAGFSGDGGPAVSAELNSPSGLAVVSGGKLLIADQCNHCIRAVDLGAGNSGVITRVAGAPTSAGGPNPAGFSGDGGPALQAKLYSPSDILVVGQVAYVADMCNHRIRSIDFQQSPPQIDTFAGGGDQSVDGARATEWKLSSPYGLSLCHDGKICVAASGSHTVIAIDLQEPHNPTSLVAGTGVGDKGADFIAATSSALCNPYAVAAVGEGTVYIAESHCIRRVAVSGASEELVAGSEAAAIQPIELMDKMTFLGAWSTLKSDGCLASPFCFPVGSAYMSPALPQHCEDFRFSLALSGIAFPPCVLGVASTDSVETLAVGLQPDGGLTSEDFEGVGVMLSPVSVRSKRLAIVRYAAGMSPTQASQASTEVMKLFLRDKITLTGSVSRKELGDGSCEYTLKDVLLNGMPAATPSFNSMTTPRVGADVDMHVFIAAWDPSSNRLKIIVQNPPFVERCGRIFCKQCHGVAE